MNKINYNKGFIVQGVIALIALLVIAGGSYYAGTKEATAPKVEENALVDNNVNDQDVVKTDTDVKVNTKPVVASNSTSDLMSVQLPAAQTGVAYTRQLSTPASISKVILIDGKIPDGLSIKSMTFIAPCDKHQNCPTDSGYFLTGKTYNLGKYSFTLQINDTIQQNYSLIVTDSVVPTDQINARTIFQVEPIIKTN